MINKNLLQGRRVFVTGGSRGLGRAICLECAGQGAHVAFSFLKDQQGAAETLSLLHHQGAEAMASQVSVLDLNAMEKTVAQIEGQWGGIDILINNAGISQVLPVALMDQEDWDQVIHTNVKGVFLSIKAFLRGMIRRKQGAILNIGSLAGMKVIESPVHYAASKAALTGLTASLAKEVGRYAIRVNCLAPGLLDGGVGGHLPEHRLKDFLKHVALKRRGTFEEVARFAAFMVSDFNSYMSGQTVLIDGGF
ncbi:MAG: SDR family oxidoreductase [Deltaproteobacteria bacterium]|nr:SDR family oxidoreductase [Deltaproteobacteria bacterium]